MLKVGRHFSVMHAIKGGWAGPTFAQAKRYESGGRKARRISKEKRKDMVESFIKKYQDSNNGNFPSLNLTHKEVGGSFYTIREIVRDIIQENRVLGPAKSLPGERDTDQSLKQFPLGTISTEPEASVSLPEDASLIGSYHHEEMSEELYFVSDKVYAQANRSDIGNGLHIAHDIKVANDEVIELHETTKNMEEEPLSSTVVTEMADVIVETFPLPPITQPTTISDGNSGEVIDLKRSLLEKDVEKPMGPGNDISLSDGIRISCDSSLVDDMEVESMLSGRGSVLVDKEAVKATAHVSERGSVLVDKEAVKATPNVPLGNSNSSATENTVSNSSATENTVLNYNADEDVAVMSSYDKAIAETKVINASNVTETKGINGTYAGPKITEPTSQEKVIIENKADVQQSSSSEKSSSPTLERINLDSWEVESKTPKRSATNPVVAALKSIIAAFAKFWS